MKHLLISAMFLCALAASAQGTGALQGRSVITFELAWEAVTPQYFSITVDSSGNAKYVSRGSAKPPEPATEDQAAEAEPDYVLEFTMSGAMRDKIFQLARNANYFNGNFDYTAHRVANTGKKTLGWSDSGRKFQTTYNWSDNKSVDQLTRIFEGISNTIEHGRKLQFLHRFDKLGLEAELKNMEALAQSGSLAEIQIIAPSLENIANDTAVLNIARQRARHLLALNPS
ncbi:MAG TPA: hypothetical protein VFK06_17325 [Candidatus Angelobacter sp.]|nr:hypothetical protein [Candidatus Angelobacter sp.]